MATHSSVLAWRIPGMGKPGGLPSLGWHRVGQDWRDLAAAVAAVQLFCDPMNCTLPGSSVHNIFLGENPRVVAIPFSRGSSQPRDPTHVSYVSCIGKRVLYYQHHLGSPIWSISSVAQSCPTLCDPMDARLPSPSPTPGVCSNSCPLSRWCHPTISSSVVPFSSCLQSCQASGSFPVTQFFASDDQSIGASASASVLSMNIQDWFPSLISLQSKGVSKSLLQHHSLGHQFFSTQLSL